jgi:hypothetical protein
MMTKPEQANIFMQIGKRTSKKLYFFSDFVLKNTIINFEVTKFGIYVYTCLPKLLTKIKKCYHVLIFHINTDIKNEETA